MAAIGSYEGRQGHGKGFKRYPVELGEELEVDIGVEPKNGRHSKNSRFCDTCP